MFEQLISKDGLSLGRLRSLLEVYEAGSIVGAAPGKSNRQTQISRELRQLSEFFGCELTERKGKVIRFTEKGSELVRLVRNYFSELEDFRATCLEEKASYLIGCGDSLIHWLVIPRLGEVASSFPKVRFSTSNLRTNDIVRQVDEGRTHFGILRKDAVPDRLEYTDLGGLRYVLVVPRKMLGRRRKPKVSDVFSDLPLAGLSSRGKFTSELRSVFAKAGCIYSPAIACESFPQILQAVLSEGYFGIVPAVAVQGIDDERFAVLPAPDLDGLSRDIVLAWSSRSEEIRHGFGAVRDSLTTALQIA